MSAKRMKETERGFISKAAMFPVHFPRLPAQRHQNSEQISCEGKLVSIFKGSNLVGGTPGAQDRVKQVFPSGRQDPENMHSTKHKQKRGPGHGGANDLFVPNILSLLTALFSV